MFALGERSLSTCEGAGSPAAEMPFSVGVPSPISVRSDPWTLGSVATMIKASSESAPVWTVHIRIRQFEASNGDVVLGSGFDATFRIVLTCTAGTVKDLPLSGTLTYTP
jgi:hypothetical protein